MMDEQWENAAEFNKFKLTFENIIEEEKVMQKEKVKHFLQIVKASLTKKFSMWISHELLFLSVFLEQKTATCIVKYLPRIDDRRDEVCVTEMNNEHIDVKASRQFLIENCAQETVIRIRNSPFYTQHAVSLRLISLGHDIWSENTNSILRVFANLYRYRYSALPINSQFTERDVKESGYFLSRLS